MVKKPVGACTSLSVPSGVEIGILQLEMSGEQKGVMNAAPAVQMQAGGEIPSSNGLLPQIPATIQGRRNGVTAMCSTMLSCLHWRENLALETSRDSNIERVEFMAKSSRRMRRCMVARHCRLLGMSVRCISTAAAATTSLCRVPHSKVFNRNWV